ncbi:MAG: hypothetical protein BWY74_02754 [Firmicutes bacterium ADurb.Bin419]|nr:MAG: hypothetical protein BWY74_02754 [Firmicutes bacterium ADurb.Bin419]
MERSKFKDKHFRTVMSTHILEQIDARFIGKANIIHRRKLL